MNIKKFETYKALLEVPSIVSELKISSAEEKKLISILKDVDSITFVGLGSSYHVAIFLKWFCYTFLQKLKVQVISTWDVLASSYSPNANELVIVISQRGKKNLTKKFLEKIKKNKKTVLITSKEGKAKKPISLTGVDAEISHAHTKSLFSAIFLTIDLLLKLTTKRHEDFILKQKDILRHLLVKVCLHYTRMKTIKSNFLINKKQGLLIHVGGGYFEWLAFEAALKFQEMASIPSYAYQLESILHGPLKSLTNKDKIIVYMPLSLSKRHWINELYFEKLKLLIKKIKKLGASFKILYFEDEFLKEAQSLHPIFQSLLFLYLIQWEALCAAILLKKNPDINEFLM